MAPAGKPIFLDVSGRRAPTLRIGAALVALFALLLLGAFVWSVAAAPRGTAFGAESFTAPPLLHKPAKQLAAARKQLFSRIAADRRDKPRAPLNSAANISGAYFAPWRSSSIVGFRAHAAQLTHVYPAWLQLTPDGKGIDNSFWRPDRQSTTKDLVQIARTNGVRIVPVISNAQSGAFDLQRVKAMLADRKAADGIAKALTTFVQGNGYQGLQIDFELLDAPTAHALRPWLQDLAKRVHAIGGELSVTLETDLDVGSAKALSSAADYAVLMAYDEHENTSAPGPVASAGYTEQMLKRFAPVLGADHLVIGVGAYGYDWNVPGKTGVPVTNQQAIALASRYRPNETPDKVIDFDPVALEPTFNYLDEKQQLHEVWFLDAVTAQNALTLARGYHVRGAALWALGMEDPSTWSAFGRTPSPSADLHKVVVPGEVQFIGDGELLRVVRRPQPGARTYDVDPKNGLIGDETYTAYPSGWLVSRSGAPEMTLCLTFDDGPDPTWTPKILDILKQEKVPATFFMIGSQVADRPGLVQRVFREGHEIGSHSFTHPNMAHVSEDRVRLELAATQRAFEAVIGRDVVLFRPPYNADSEPHSYGEIMPIAVANEQGYVVAGETIDPNDWDTIRPGPNGTRVKLTGDEIVKEVMARHDYGQAILMHDGGGDRSATVAALPSMIRQLKALGYRFTTIGELEGRSRDATMPPIPPKDRSIAAVDNAAFTAKRVFDDILFWGFSLAIGLGLARIALMIGLTARQRRERPPLIPNARVDVLVAAYNEAQVIVRTVSSVLASEGVDVRVIVVDDGSSDETYRLVEEAYGADPRVSLYKKANGGKASALNVALEHATAEVVVGVDADTQLDPNALALLARWFVNPDIGAVAGNVKVGNRFNIVTRWQSLEYITSQNVDRRAMSRLNAVTVVPGAIGAYRAEALRQVGGYRSDTLAEDMDLTWRLRIAGWAAQNENDALAYTEAPSSLGALMKQRFRWTFGTLQCLWKHRGATFHYGWFGWLALPTLWLFQIAAQVLAPFVDLQLLVAAIARIGELIAIRAHDDVQPAADNTLWIVAVIYVAFIALEFAAGWVAYAFDREDKRELLLLPTQRLVYRQIMYLVVWRALLRAFGGVGQGWGKLKRTGAVRVEDRAAASRPLAAKRG